MGRNIELGIGGGVMMDELQETQKAWVVFSGKTDLRWLGLLKPGFRHCFVLLNDGLKWMSYDPLANYTEVKIYHH